MIALTNEIIADALMRCGTAVEAAKSLGISVTTVYRRLRDKEFKAFYRSLQADMLRQTVTDLMDTRDEALTVMKDIMRDSEVHPATRLQAAQSILSNDLKYAGRLATVENEIDGIAQQKQLEDYALRKLKERKDAEEKHNNLKGDGRWHTEK